MSVAKVIEIKASSNLGFEDAVKRGVDRATDTMNDVTGAWVKDHEVRIENGQITEYRVTLKVTFILKGGQ